MLAGIKCSQLKQKINKPLNAASVFFFQPPLVQAIFSGDPEEIRMLIYKTEDVNALVCDLACCAPLLMDCGNDSIKNVLSN